MRGGPHLSYFPSVKFEVTSSGTVLANLQVLFIVLEDRNFEIFLKERLN